MGQIRTDGTLFGYVNGSLNKGYWLGAGARVYPLRLGVGNTHSKQLPKLYAHTVAFALASDHVLTNVQLKHVAQRAFKQDSVDYWLHHASERIDWDAAEPEERLSQQLVPSISCIMGVCVNTGGHRCGNGDLAEQHAALHAQERA